MIDSKNWDCKKSKKKCGELQVDRVPAGQAHIVGRSPPPLHHYCGCRGRVRRTLIAARYHRSNMASSGNIMQMNFTCSVAFAVYHPKRCISVSAGGQTHPQLLAPVSVQLACGHRLTPLQVLVLHRRPFVLNGFAEWLTIQGIAKVVITWSETL
ncbi:hypothetical protein J6590_003520 [Homalodisca vitripennis]|nr:hypothetical protein J6590_003520 [Homalodisca vitripennis]